MQNGFRMFLKRLQISLRKPPPGVFRGSFRADAESGDEVGRRAHRRRFSEVLLPEPMNATSQA
eukprot:983142-Alexandrium_andersonii.AAC.1